MRIHSSDRAIAIFGLFALAAAIGIGRFAFTPILPMMLADGSLNVAEGGFLASAHFVGYAAGALIATRMNGKRMINGSLVAISVATLAMAFSDVMQVWTVARFIAGICSAFVLIAVSSHTLSALTAADRVDLQAMVFAGVGVGIVGVGLSVLVMSIIGVSSAGVWMALGIVVLVIAVQRAPVEETRRDSQPDEHSDHSLGTRLPWHLVLPYAAIGLGYIIPATFLPVMAERLTPSILIYGWGWPLFGTAAAISTIWAGILHRHFSNRVIWIGSQSIMATGLMLPVVLEGIWPIMMAALCVGGTFMVITMAGIREARRITTGQDSQRLIAVLTFGFALGQIIGPFGAGWIASGTGTFAWPLAIASIILALTILPMLKSATERRGSEAGGNP